MDYDIYYDRKHDGSYVLHFPNNHGWDLKRIEDMFSQYGKVLSVNNRGTTNGLCFVRYKHLDAVKRCIDGFYTNEGIKILPHKHKLNKVNRNAKSNVQEVNTNQSMLFKLNKQSNIETRGGHNIINKDSQYGQTPKEKNNSKRDSSISQRSTDSKSYQSNELQQYKQLQDVALGSFDSTTSIHDSPIFTASTAKCGVVPAHEVIVANIHVNFGIHYILHLFEDYSNPICVSLMKIIPRTSIRYCHVYFKTLEEAIAVEKKFDNFALSGHKLIVLRRTELLEEYLLS